MWELWRSSDSPSYAADLCWTSFTYLLWFLYIVQFGILVYFRCRCIWKVVTFRLHVWLAGLFLVFLEWIFLDVWRLYNGRTCGRSFSFGWADVVLYVGVGSVLIHRWWIRWFKPNSRLCVCREVIYRWTPSWYGNFASDWGIAGSP